MTLAILETGAPPRRLIGKFGRYPDMFRALLGEAFVEASYDVAAGEYPDHPARHRAYLITGAAAGVYDPLPWIDPLKQFLISAKDQARLVGVCFGHQIMAEAFGGRVAKSDKGWGIGLASYGIHRRLPWMDDVASVAVPVSHQDQVVEQPPHSEIVGGSDFCDIGFLAYTDQPAISFQFHPEFSPAYAQALIELRRDSLDQPDRAIAALAQPNDNARIGAWVRRFVAG